MSHLPEDLVGAVAVRFIDPLEVIDVGPERDFYGTPSSQRSSIHPPADRSAGT